ncbi:hypothetical protein GEMRC1_013465 [Eukaryota sp. GEM-RC1]
MEAGDSFTNLAGSGKLSSQFPTSVLQQRWKSMLTDPDFVQKISKTMAGSISLGKRAKWTDIEERLLRDGVANNFVSFANILETHKSKFHPTRTPKSLEAHYYKMKRAGNLPAAVPMASAPIPAPPAPSSLLPTVTEIQTGAIPEIIQKEPEPPAQVILNLEHYLKPIPEQLGYSYPGAILMGRVCSFPISCKRSLIGRQVKGNPVDVDVTKEACSASVSRRQAVLWLSDDPEECRIENIGKNPIIVDGNVLYTGDKFRVLDQSLLEFSCIRLILFIYQENMSNLTLVSESVSAIPDNMVKEEFEVKEEEEDDEL